MIDIFKQFEVFQKENVIVSFRGEVSFELVKAILDNVEYRLVKIEPELKVRKKVINVLIEVCSHTPEQAEQCTLMIHYKGKCCVKHGDWDKLVAMRNAICERGLSAEVE